MVIKFRVIPNLNFVKTESAILLNKVNLVGRIEKKEIREDILLPEF